MSKRFSEACQRNKAPILDVLSEYLSASNRILEIGSGTGQHAVYFAENLPAVHWQPSDRQGRLASVQARVDESELPNLSEPIACNLFDEQIPVEEVDAIAAINVLQIAPRDAIYHLFRHARQLTGRDGLVYLYGPYRYEDEPLEPSNKKFHRQLQRRDPDMGIPLFENVASRARQFGFELVDDVQMPANNRSIIWKKSRVE